MAAAAGTRRPRHPATLGPPARRRRMPVARLCRRQLTRLAPTAARRDQHATLPRTAATRPCIGQRTGCTVPKFSAFAQHAGTGRVRAIADRRRKCPLSRHARRLVQSGTRLATSVAARRTRHSRGRRDTEPTIRIRARAVIAGCARGNRAGASPVEQQPNGAPKRRHGRADCASILRLPAAARCRRLMNAVAVNHRHVNTRSR